MNHCAQYLYVLGNGSQWQNNELRYSLRSLDLFCPAEKTVYIAGEKPDWINWGRGIHHIPLPETNGSKVQRVGRKLIGAMPYLQQREFVLMNDDFILTRWHDCGNGFRWGMRHRGPVLDHMASVAPKYVTPRVSTNRHGSMYYRGMKRSYDRVREAGIENVLGYNVHLPMDLRSDLVLATGAFAPFWEGYSFRILYGNLYATNEDRNREPIEDHKLSDAPETWSIAASGLHCVSLRSRVDEPVRQWLRDSFEGKSRWEL